MFWIASDSNSLHSNQICPKSSIPASLSIQGQAVLLIAIHLSPACYTPHLCWEPILPTIPGSPESLTRHRQGKQHLENPVSGGEWMLQSFLRGLRHPCPSLSTWLTPISSAILCLVSPTGRGQLPCDIRLRIRCPILSRCSFQKASKAHGNIGFHVVTMPSWRAT